MGVKMSKILPIILNKRGGIASAKGGEFYSANPTYIADIARPTRKIELPVAVSNLDNGDIHGTALYPVWNSTEPPPVEFGSNIFDVIQKSHTVLDFYVDSVALQDLTPALYSAGSGSADKPWRNLIHAFTVLSCLHVHIIENLCDDVYIYLHVKGIVDYTFNSADWGSYGDVAPYLADMPLYDKLIIDFATCTFDVTEYITSSRPYSNLYPCYAVINLIAKITINNERDSHYGYTYNIFGQRAELCIDSKIKITGNQTGDGYLYIRISPALLHTSTVSGNITDNLVVTVDGAVYNSSVTNIYPGTAYFKHSELIGIVPVFAQAKTSIVAYDCIITNPSVVDSDFTAWVYLYNSRITLTGFYLEGRMYNSRITTDAGVNLYDKSNHNQITATFDMTTRSCITLNDNNCNNTINCKITAWYDYYPILLQATDIYAASVQINNEIICNATISMQDSRLSVLGAIVRTSLVWNNASLLLQDCKISVSEFNVTGEYYGIQVCALSVAPADTDNVNVYNCTFWQGLCKPGKGFNEYYDECIASGNKCPEWCDNFECFGV